MGLTGIRKGLLLEFSVLYLTNVLLIALLQLLLR